LELVFKNATDHFKRRAQEAELQQRHAVLTEETSARNARLDKLDKEAQELRTRAAEFTEQEKEKLRLENALVRSRTDGHQHAVLSQLNDLGELYQQRQISDEEFHSMRKSLLDKAYKNIH